MAELKSLPTPEVIREMKYSELMNLIKDPRIKTKFDGEKRGELAEKIIKELEGPSSKETESENFVSELIVIFNNIQKEDDELDSKQYRDHDDIVALFEETMDNEDSSLNPDELETIYDRTLENFLKPKPVKETKKEGVSAVEGAKKKGKPETQYDITEEQQAIIDNDDISKSDKIRQLHELGVPVAVIAKKIDVQYSHAYTVVKKLTDAGGGSGDKKDTVTSKKEEVEVPEEEDDDEEEMPELEEEKDEEEEEEKLEEKVETSAKKDTTEKVAEKVTEKPVKEKSTTKKLATEKSESVAKEDKSIKKKVIKKMVKLVIEVARILPD